MDNNEWKIDENGRRYRMFGKGCKEYEMEFSFVHPQIDKEKEERERKEAQEREARRHTGRDCPFKKGLNVECLTECTLYGNTACALSMKETPPDKDTNGRDCPIYQKKCSEKCAFYFNGCGLIHMVKGLKAGKEN
jgi:hypothetical protein